MKNIIKNTAFAVALIIAGANASAQSLTGYFMNNLTNTNIYNPAFNPHCKVYVSLYDIYVGAAETGFTIKDMVKKVPKQDKYVIDLDQIYSSLRKNNFLYADQNIQLLNFGFRLGEGYVHAGLSLRAFEGVSFPKDLMKLKDGTYFDKESTIDLSGLDAKVNAFLQYSWGYSWEFSDKITFGAALKRLKGIGNVRTKKFDMVLTTDDDMYDLSLKTDIELQIGSGADLQFAYNDKGMIDSVYANNIKDLDDMKTDDYKTLLNTKNGGWAIDLGMTYKFDDRLQFAASITDLGGIKWKKYGKTIKQGGTFDFTGVDIAKYFSDLDSLGEVMKDSIAAFATPEDNSKGYTDFLNTKIYLSAEYKVNNVINLGMMFRGIWFSKKFHPSLTSSVNFRLGRATQISISQSFINRKANVWGLGYSQQLGPLQLYFIADQFSPAFWAMNDGKTADKWIRNTNTFSFQTGMSIIIGRKKYYEKALFE
ncbi:MAG: hypothetical protein IKS00_08765 [Bacteroidales bacterium]|nr:hypothetical protein [Bacteroidales bacterium]